MSRVFAYFAQSLDGYIAGADGDLSFLGEPDDEMGAAFARIMVDTGCMVMGRNTYDVVAAFGEAKWPYGATPMIVATSRALRGAPPTVQARSGTPQQLLDAARALAGDKAVYVDGGHVVRQMLAAGLVDEFTVSLVPAVVGDGVRLFLDPLPPLALQAQRTFANGTVSLTYAVRE